MYLYMYIYIYTYIHVNIYICIYLYMYCLGDSLVSTLFVDNTVTLLRPGLLRFEIACSCKTALHVNLQTQGLRCTNSHAV